jgi:hypothetical protein
MSHERVLVAIIDANKLGSMGPLATVHEIVLNGRICRYTPLDVMGPVLYTPLDVMGPVLFDIPHSITSPLFLGHTVLFVSWILVTYSICRLHFLTVSICVDCYVWDKHVAGKLTV